MSESNKRPPKVRVGTEMTAYTREEALIDPKHKDAFLGGEDVPAEIPRFPTRPFLNLRWDIEKFCRYVFKKKGLPDPFLLLSQNEEAETLEWSLVSAWQPAKMVSIFDSGYTLCALLHCPVEDHSDLWYASRLSITLVQLDILQAKMKAGHTLPAEGTTLAAHLGCEIGRLENECKLKLRREKNWRLGKQVRKGRSKGGKAKSAITKPVSDAIVAAMQKRIHEGNETVRNAARLVRELDGLGKSAEANRRLYTRRQEPK